MALDTVSISDIGASLIAIENEIKANISSIKYYEALAEEYKVKNKALKDLAGSLIKTALPQTSTY